MHKPKKPILSRYARTEDGKVILDIASVRIQDLYNDFDRVAPYVRKDLDEDVATYILDCAREIGKTPFVLRLTVFHQPTPELEDRIRNSIQNYFRYLQELEKRKVRKMLRTSSILLMVGIAILAFSVWFHQRLNPTSWVLTFIFAEGLTVAAWVAMWESLATFLIHWFPSHNEIKLLDRIANAIVHLNVEKDFDG